MLDGLIASFNSVVEEVDLDEAKASITASRATPVQLDLKHVDGTKRPAPVADLARVFPK